MELLYQGHASLRLITESGTVLYVDPCAGIGYEQPADILLVTHNHDDHSRIEKPVRKDGCVVLDPANMLNDGDYTSIQVADVQIESVPAYNQNHKKSACVGYLVRADGLCFYFAGDTSKIPEMADLRDRLIDYAFFPVDGFYNMDEIEAMECAEMVGATYSIPIHMVPFHGKMKALFSESKAERFRPKGRLILRPGETITM